MANALDTTTKLVENPKRMIALIILIVVIIIVYFVFRNKIKGLFSNLQNKVENNQALNEEIKATGESTTYTESAYKTYAQRLYNAMKGIGTDEATIYAVFNEMRNTADVLKLVAVYGIRDNETLSQWLHGDLSSREIKKLNQILTSKGINYQF